MFPLLLRRSKMSLLVFENGVYIHKPMPEEKSYTYYDCTLEVSDAVKYINNDCIELGFDGSTMTVYPWMQRFFITVKDIASVTTTSNQYGTIRLLAI